VFPPSLERPNPFNQDVSEMTGERVLLSGLERALAVVQCRVCSCDIDMLAVMTH
jgi:hypothetical protein